MQGPAIGLATYTYETPGKDYIWRVRNPSGRTYPCCTDRHICGIVCKVQMRARAQDNGSVTAVRVNIYTGILGQIGDIIMFTATARRIKECFPNGQITFAISARYAAAADLVTGLGYINRIFTTRLYFERLTNPIFTPWNLGWPVDLRGEDEIAEQRKHDIVLETRPRHADDKWWEHAHQVEELAAMVGVPGPIDRRTDIVIPPGTVCPAMARGKIVLHNDPAIDKTKTWPWPNVQALVDAVGPEQVVLLGNAGPEVPGTVDLRGRTTLTEAAAVIAASQCYIGIDSGLMWIAGSLQVRTIGLYGTSYIPRPEAVQPLNPNATYLNTEGTLEGISAADVLRHL